jgi:hypothetical protein
LECANCNWPNSDKSGVVSAYNHIHALDDLQGWHKIRSQRPDGTMSRFARLEPWDFGPGYDLGLIPKPTEDQDGRVTWALRKDTHGGMFTVDNDSTFS